MSALSSSLLLALALPFAGACGSSAAAPSGGDDVGPQPDAPAAPIMVKNPVRGGAADPFLFFHDGAYYLTYTTVDHLEVVKARSISELATATPTEIWRDATPSRCCNMWAPELHHAGAHWYAYYTADDGQIQNHRMYVLESAGDDPLGPYSFKAQLATQTFFSIDGTVAEIAGAPYFVWSSVPPGQPQSLYIASMANPWTLASAPSLLSLPYLPWEIHGRRVNEGPIGLNHDGVDYIVFSASACETPDYALGTLTYHDLGGGPLDNASWTKSDDPQFVQSPEHHVYGPGHNSFFRSPDGAELWNAYHAVDNPAGSCGGDRSLRVQPVGWRGDGSPDFGTPVDTTAIVAPSGDPGPGA